MGAGAEAVATQSQTLTMPSMHSLQSHAALLVLAAAAGACTVAVAAAVTAAVAAAVAVAAGI